MVTLLQLKQRTKKPTSNIQLIQKLRKAKGTTQKQEVLLEQQQKEKEERLKLANKKIVTKNKRGTKKTTKEYDSQGYLKRVYKVTYKKGKWNTAEEKTYQKGQLIQREKRTAEGQKELKKYRTQLREQAQKPKDTIVYDKKGKVKQATGKYKDLDEVHIKKVWGVRDGKIYWKNEIAPKIKLPEKPKGSQIITDSEGQEWYQYKVGNTIKRTPVPEIVKNKIVKYKTKTFNPKTKIQKYKESKINQIATQLFKQSPLMLQTFRTKADEEKDKIYNKIDKFYEEQFIQASKTSKKRNIAQLREQYLTMSQLAKNEIERNPYAYEEAKKELLKKEDIVSTTIEIPNILYPTREFKGQTASDYFTTNQLNEGYIQHLREKGFTTEGTAIESPTTGAKLHTRNRTQKLLKI